VTHSPAAPVLAFFRETDVFLSREVEGAAA